MYAVVASLLGTTGVGAGGPDDPSVERIAGLVRLWGAVWVAHPWVAEDLESWDRAFSTASEAMLAAPDCEKFDDTVSDMLAQIGDDATRIHRADSETIELSQPPADRLSAPSLAWPNEHTAYIDASDWVALTIGAGGLNAMHRPMFSDVFEAAREATTVVIDLRRPAWDGNPGEFDSGSFMLSVVLRRELPILLSRDLILPARIQRQHHGYSNEGITSELYSSGHYIQDYRRLPARNQGQTGPTVVFWTNRPNDGTPGVDGIADLLSAVQSSGQGLVLTTEGDAPPPDPYAAPFSVSLPCDVTATVRTGAMLNSDGTMGLSSLPIVAAGSGFEDWLAATSIAVGAAEERGDGSVHSRFPIVASPEPRYRETDLPTVGFRLLALARFWTAINYHFPYKSLMDDSWEDVLGRFVPLFRDAESPLAYATAVARLGVLTQDSHTSISAESLSQFIGEATAPLLARMVEDEIVLVWVGAGEHLAQLSPGDIVVSVDGKSASERLEEILELTPGSNLAARTRNAALRLFSGQAESAMLVEVEKPDGRRVSVEVVPDIDPQLRKTLYAALKTTREAEMLTDAIGYFDISRVTQAGMSESIARVSAARQMIFDMRGYPNVPVTLILNQFANGTATGAITTTPLAGSLNPLVTRAETVRQDFVANARSPISGEIVILVNRWTQSAAEHTVLFLKAAFGERATIIGEPSAGANGVITFAYLPGNISVSFTGMEVRWPDGGQLQRIGIQPDRTVRPSIAGVRSGQDEVLQAAITHLQSALE